LGMITGIILASGFSQRMNTEKLLLSVEGMPVVERVIRAATLSRLDHVILVYQKEEIKELGKKYNIVTVCNHRANEGQSAAIKKGIPASSPESDAFMFLVGDQPFLDLYTINTLIDTFLKDETPIVVPVYRGRRGNPVIFSSKLKDKLLKLEGDCGGRTIINQMEESVRFVPIESTFIGIDIDTREDYERITTLASYNT
jgi:molybdenum cofactor cytidylyltransferase